MKNFNSKSLIFVGSKHELQLYPKLTLTGFVQRLLTQRCVAFFKPEDNYLLLSGQKGQGGFLTVGSLDEKPPLTLANVLSYDEIKLSAFLSISSKSDFLNDGNRQNVGIIEQDKGKIEVEGLVVGIVGGRFEHPDVMEWQDILITETQNIKENGYGTGSGTEADMLTNDKQKDYRSIWRQFYEEDDFLYKDVVNKNSPRFSKNSQNTNIFDNVIMKKRYAISFDTLLLESEAKADKACKQAYIHLVGIGLGVWKAVDHQKEILLLTFTQRLKLLLPQLNHIDCVHFNWFNTTECGDLKDGGIFESKQHPNGGIRTFLSNRNPADKLPTEFCNSLLVVSYAWDGNALPGNAFWVGDLNSTGDSSAVCSTLITELHNPHINTEMVNGENLHVATLQHGVVHISNYSKEIFW